MGSQRGAVGTVRTCEGPRGPCAGDNEREVQRPMGSLPLSAIGTKSGLMGTLCGRH